MLARYGTHRGGDLPGAEAMGYAGANFRLFFLIFHRFFIGFSVVFHSNPRNYRRCGNLRCRAAEDLNKNDFKKI